MNPFTPPTPPPLTFEGDDEFGLFYIKPEDVPPPLICAGSNIPKLERVN